jgi:predicted tellurium resistance membrane protein TerC
MDLALIGTFFILVGLELVLGIDNVLLVSVVADRCAPEHRDRVRKLGILAAAGGRLILLAGIGWVIKLQKPVMALGGFSLSWKDVILLAGGLFLLFKAVKEIHHTVEYPLEASGAKPGPTVSVASAICQILLLDLVFSIDSVITAVGLTQVQWVMYTAVIASVLLVLTISGPIARFIRANPALKVLALSFLVVIGVTIFLEGLHKHVEKGYIYLPLGFCLVVELLQMRQKKKLVAHSV